MDTPKPAAGSPKAVTARRRRLQFSAVVEFLVNSFLAIAVLLLAIAILQQNRLTNNLESGIACRSRVNAEVAGISDEITAKTSEIFVAGIRDDDPTVAELGEELEVLSKRMYPAIERRNRAVESCRR